MTTVKRKPLSEIPQDPVNRFDEGMTVEEFLKQQCEEMIQDIRHHSAALIAQLKQEYRQGVAEVKSLMSCNNTFVHTKLCVTLKCVKGAHVGQKFRLEPTTDNGEDEFKIGRSTGRLFKEKGVCLYKDKEISTTHAKVGIKNGEAFLIDNSSTNGTELNGLPVEPLVPLRLQEGDCIVIGTTELIVHISDISEEENTVSV